MEYFDLYTMQRERTGQTLARGSEIPKGMTRLIVFVCIFNSRGEMLIQQRAASKKSWGGLWDVSVGGHVLAGETSAQAGEREAQEELGCRIELAKQQPAMTIYYEDSMHDIFVTEKDLRLEDLQIQTEEVDDIRWASEEQIHEMIEEGSFIPVYREFISLMFRMHRCCGIIRE